MEKHSNELKSFSQALFSMRKNTGNIKSFDNSELTESDLKEFVSFYTKLCKA